MPPQRRNWKSCASHVYIAHFIEYELHRERCVLASGARLFYASALVHDLPSHMLSLLLPRHSDNTAAHCHGAVLCRLQKQQHQQRIMSRINGADNSQGEGSMNGDHVAASAAPLTERLGSGQQGGGLPGSLPKRVTPLQSSAALQSLAPGNGLGQVAL